MNAPRISAGWDHDRAHFHFSRVHHSSAPFKRDEPHPAFQFGVALLIVSGFAAFCFVALGC